MRAKSVVRGAIAVCLFVIFAVTATADEVVTSTVDLENTDACNVTEKFEGVSTAIPSPDVYLQVFAERMFEGTCPRTGYERPMRSEAACGTLYPETQPPSLIPLPEDVSVRPLMLECRNAVQICGPAEAVATVQNQVKQLDTPGHDLVLEVRWVDWPEPKVDELKLDWTEVQPGTGVGIDHPAHPLQYAPDPIGAVVGMMADARDEWFPKCAEFYLDDGVQSILAMGEVARWCCPLMEYDSWARQPIEYRDLNCFFFGVEMWVLPEITEEGAVKLRLRPRTGEAAGDLKQGDRTGLRWELCEARTLVRHQGQEFTITVNDGASVLIRGLVRSDSCVKGEIKGPDRPEYTNNFLSRHPTLIITPRVLAD